MVRLVLCNFQGIESRAQRLLARGERGRGQAWSEELTVSPVVGLCTEYGTINVRGFNINECGVGVERCEAFAVRRTSKSQIITLTSGEGRSPLQALCKDGRWCMALAGQWSVVRHGGGGGCIKVPRLLARSTTCS